MGRLRGFPRRFRLPWRSAGRIRRDVDDELEFHITAKIEALQQDGLGADEAREEAFRQFGEFDAARDRLVASDRRGERRTWFKLILEDLVRDARLGCRSLRRTPGFTIVAVLILGLGIGVVAGAFSLVNVYALKPVLMADPDNVVAVVARHTVNQGYRPFSYPEYVELRERVESFSNLTAYYVFDAGVDDGNLTRRASVAVASSNYFDTFGVPLASGRGFTFEEERGDDPPTAVVGYDFWERAGKDPEMLGSSIRINGGSFVVVGIAPRGFTGTMAVLGPDVWVPLASMRRVQLAEGADIPDLGDPRHHALLLLGRLDSGVTEEAARSELGVLAAGIAANLDAPDGAPFTYTTGGFGRFTYGAAPASNEGFLDDTIVPFALSTIVLLIACLNLANMILARGAARRGEIWIRQSLGGGRSRLIRQVMTEGALLAIAGGVIALGWSYFANTRIVAAIAEAIPLDLTVAVDLRPDARVLGATVISCIVATLLFGFVPALRVTKQDLASGIKQGAFATAFKRSRGGKLLSVGSTMIVAQIALSLVMLTVGGLFIRSTVVAANALPPFSLDDILLVELHTGLAGYDEPRSVAIYKNVLERVRSLPDVQHAGMTSLVPLSGISQARSLKPAGTPQDLPGVGGHFSTVTDGYFDALGLPVSRGRDFTEAEIESGTTPPVAIIDDAFATQLFPDGDALGRQVQGVSFDADGEPIALTIVGIAPPLPGQDIDPAPRRHAYVPYRQAYNSNMTVVIAVRDGLPDPSTLLPTIRQLIRAIDPALPILSVKSMRTLRSENWSLRMLTLGSRLFMLLGAAALCLAMVGLYGVKSFLISQRTREIGVRMALGATRSDVQRALLRQSLAVTALGLGVGCIVAIAVGRIVSSMLYGVSGMDGLVLSSATVLLAAAAMLASFLPVLRATRSQPIAALRYE